MNQDSYSLYDRLKELDTEYTNLEKTRFSISQPSVSHIEVARRKKVYDARLRSFDIFVQSYCIQEEFFNSHQDQIIKEAKGIIKDNYLFELKQIPTFVEKIRNILRGASILKDNKDFELLCRFAIDSCVFIVTEFLLLSPTLNSSELGECIKKMNLIGRSSTHFKELKRILSDHKVDIRTGNDVAVGFAKESAEEGIGCIVKIFVLCLLAFLIATMLGAK